jgi:HYR domain-containing protein
MIRSRTKTVVALALAAVLAVVVPAAANGSAGALTVRADLSTAWQPISCPAGTTGAKPLCDSIQGEGVIPGLGRTTESYTYVIDDSTASSTSIHFLATITVPAEGEIDVSGVTPSPICPCVAHTVSFNYTITGGKGAYGGAQGSGKVVLGSKVASWKGTLAVPGFTFDTTPPVISHSVPKRIKAAAGATKVRVGYKVSARDPGAGSVPVTCTPRSGSRFKVGRTMVRCSATDAVGNTTTARFPVVVRR